MKKVSILLVIMLILSTGLMSAAHASEETWTCPNGHEGNTGKFCPECGAEKPAPVEEWTCKNGHEGNTGNYCTQCGAPKPVGETWTCKNGHEGNTDDYCARCGAPKPAQPETTAPEPSESEATASEPVQLQTAAEEPEPQQDETAAPEPEPETEASYDNPFPDIISQFNVPFSGVVADHQVAMEEVLSHENPSDEYFVEFEDRGKASEQLAWDRYIGATHELYMVYQNGGNDVYAYVYKVDLDSSKRTDWAAGSLMPNVLNAISSVLWVESGEDNDVYNELLDKGAEESDYDSVKALLRSMDSSMSAQWFSHWMSMTREELDDGTDRYWVIFHNTEL